MKIRLTKPFGDVAAGGLIRSAGTIMDVPDGVAEMWIRRGRAERVEDAPVETPPSAKRPQRKKVAADGP